MPDDDFYSWQPNKTLIRDPETNSYIGNVIMDLSKSEQVSIINDVAEEKKREILDASQSWKDRIHTLSTKHVNLVSLIRAMSDGMREEFGIPEEIITSEFTLGVSQFDSGILG